MKSVESDFLKDIGVDWESVLPRLQFADWLDEQGDGRAELIRVQCELERSGDSESSDKLRLQEYDLICEHRESWIDSLGLPVDEFTLRRGVADALHLSEWTDQVIAVAEEGRLSSLTELDLSGLSMSDVDFRSLLGTKRFPALRKLIISGNSLTAIDPGELAAACPSVQTIYLFENSQEYSRESAEELIILHSSLETVDVGEKRVGYSMTQGQADLRRREFVRQNLLPYAQACFNNRPSARSAILYTAQYWDDEANDAVHELFLLSESLTPSLSEWEESGESWHSRQVSGDPDDSDHTSWEYNIFENENVKWGSNLGAIPLWASFTKEGCHQEQDYGESYSPAVTIFRHGGYVFHPQLRPWLDGIQADRESLFG